MSRSSKPSGNDKKAIPKLKDRIEPREAQEARETRSSRTAREAEQRRPSPPPTVAGTNGAAAASASSAASESSSSEPVRPAGKNKGKGKSKLKKSKGVQKKKEKGKGKKNKKEKKREETTSSSSVDSSESSGSKKHKKKKKKKSKMGDDAIVTKVVSAASTIQRDLIATVQSTNKERERQLVGDVADLKEDNRKLRDELARKAADLARAEHRISGFLRVGADPNGRGRGGRGGRGRGGWGGGACSHTIETAKLAQIPDVGALAHARARGNASDLRLNHAIAVSMVRQT